MMHLGKFHSHLHTLVIHFRLNSDRYQNILYYILMYTSDINRMELVSIFANSVINRPLLLILILTLLFVI
jgi:hypothetical protein